MRFPTVFRRQKGSASADPALGSDAVPSTSSASAKSDNVVFCALRDLNGWPCQRIAVGFFQSSFLYTITSAGTAPPVVTLTGSTPTLVAIEIDVNNTAGGTALGQALFQWKLNGVVQQAGQATAASFVLGTTGLTAHFSAGPYTNDNVYTSHAATTHMNLDAYFFEDATQQWFKINDSAIDAKPAQLYFFDTVTILEQRATNAMLGNPGSPAQAGGMAVMIVPSDPGSQLNGVFTFVAGPDLTTVGT